MIGVLHAPSTTAELTAAMETAPPHLRAVLLGVRDHRVGLLITTQGTDAFAIPSKPRRNAALVMIADDMSRSLGPNGFHQPSVRRAIRACRAFAVVSSAASPEVYASLTAFAVGGRNAMIVETQLAHEFQWVALIQKLAPGRPLIISTVKGGTA